MDMYVQMYCAALGGVCRLYACSLLMLESACTGTSSTHCCAPPLPQRLRGITVQRTVILYKQAFSLLPLESSRRNR